MLIVLKTDFPDVILKQLMYIHLLPMRDYKSGRTLRLYYTNENEYPKLALFISHCVALHLITGFDKRELSNKEAK